ncbi:MAG: hypothetical protein ABL964_12815 [Steroidobacteraceae bacterium]
MLYPDGTEMRMGDRVRIKNGDTGTIVFSLDTREFSDEYPMKSWDYLESGVMVRTDKGALVHFETSTPRDMVERE